ncbi:hypothetical protein LTR86_000169 [Recurvomyces mirabilis]|nr:hypothetical protein LTR86_000169 [Recurvomyces mirabilis]
MTPSVDLIEGSPPYLHTRYLSTEQQKHCLESPTYSTLLTELKPLREEIQESRIEYEVGLRTHRFNKRHRESRKHDLRDAEDHFRSADDALAMLAEALIVGPVFQISDEVTMMEGKWMWQLPGPEPRMQRDMSDVQMDNALPRHEDPSTAFVRPKGPTATRRLSRSITGGLSRVFSKRERQTEEVTAPVTF